MATILEEMLEHLVNENRTQAEELFHDYVVAKSREIYESLLEESYSDDDAGDDEGEFEEAFDFGKAENDDDFGDEEGSEDDDQFGEKEFGDEEGGEDSKEEVFQSLDEIVDELQAKFDELRSLTGSDSANDDAGFGGDATDELEDEVDDSDEKEESFELETVREYVEKVGTDWGKSPKMGDNGANAKSIVAGKNDMGGTTANILNTGTSDTGGTQGGLVNPKAQDLKSGNINVPGGKAGDAYKKAAAPKKADDGANSTSLFRNKR